MQLEGRKTRSILLMMIEHLQIHKATHFYALTFRHKKRCGDNTEHSVGVQTSSIKQSRISLFCPPPPTPPSLLPLSHLSPFGGQTRRALSRLPPTATRDWQAGRARHYGGRAAGTWDPIVGEGFGEGRLAQEDVEELEQQW